MADPPLSLSSTPTMSTTTTTTTDAAANAAASTFKFSNVTSFFHYLSKSKTTPKKRTQLRKYLDQLCPPEAYFPSLRLLLPALDRHRRSYGLKESTLALSLLDALSMARDSPDALKLLNWRKGGSRNSGDLAGNFAAVAADLLQRRQSSVSAGVTVAEVNSLLDRLAAAESRTERNDVIGEMIRRTSWQEMKWLIMLILKDLKLGISEKSVFAEFHPDAEDLFNVTCDLRVVFERLRDRSVRLGRKDIEVGKAVRPQLAKRAFKCAEAWKALHGKEVVVECKFDGDRIQVHRDGGEVRYFSRNFIDHTEYVAGMNGVIVENVLSDKCILDGEMLVWDRGRNRFEEFGSNQEIARLARDGLDGERNLCYVAFDVLYVGDSSVIHRSLKERQELLRKVVRPVKGRLEILVPGGSESLNAHRPAGEPCWSMVVNRLDEVERFFKETIDNRDEGIVLKDLGSKWEPGDRSGKWLKVKPDYVQAGADLDALIIGGYYGTGRRGGEVAQFLLGLAERPSTPNTYPRKFISFCRVGSGLSDEECSELVVKLKPYFRKYEYPKKSAPSFYQVTNNSKERPDVWIDSPEKSVILSITSDIRTINSEVFAAPYSLRFPRIDRVRYDKPWHECLDVQSLVELVQSSNGTTQRGGGGGDNDGAPGGKPKRARAAKGEGRKKVALAVPSHFARTDVSSVKGESRLFSDMVVYFVNVPSDKTLDSLHKLVVENGGTFSMNLNDTVTHCVGAEARGIKYEAAKRRGRDVIHYSWLLDCCLQKLLLPLRPNSYVFLSDSSRKKLQEEIDEFSDSYFWDINVSDLKQIMCNVNRSEDAKTVDYYKKKYCPRVKWRCFHGCRIYLHLVPRFPSADWEVFLGIAMRRMKVEVSVGGGKIVDNPSRATHIVVMSVPGHELNFERLLQSFPEDKKRVLHLKRIHVVGSQWLENCFEKGQKLQEVAYTLKPDTWEDSASAEEEDENEMDIKNDPASHVREEKPKEPVPSKTSKVVPLIREPRRKRGRPVGTSTRKGKAPPISKPPRPKRAKVGKRSAKLKEVAFDDEDNEQEHDLQGKASPELDLSPDIAPDDKYTEQNSSILGKSSPEIEDSELVLQPDSSEKSQKPKEEGVSHGFDEMKSHSLDHAGKETCSKPEKDEQHSTAGKLEDMYDPVQAMLFDMLPSLKSISGVSNRVVERKDLPPTRPEESTSSSLREEPVKKKKVSYRELANQLLKD